MRPRDRGPDRKRNVNLRDLRINQKGQVQRAKRLSRADALSSMLGLNRVLAPRLSHFLSSHFSTFFSHSSALISYIRYRTLNDKPPKRVGPSRARATRSVRSDPCGLIRDPIRAVRSVRSDPTLACPDPFGTIERSVRSAFCAVGSMRSDTCDPIQAAQSK